MLPRRCATVPNMVGKTRASASSAMDTAGFTGGREQFAQVPADAVVVSQNPQPGTIIGKADSVELTFATGAAAAPAQAAPQQAASAPSGPLTQIGPGTYEVGTGDGQVAPGKYKTTGPGAGSYGGSCYWARLKNTNGDFNSIITNGNAPGPSVVTISKNDGAFETQCTWSKAG